MRAESTSRIDGKGRIMLPESVRQATKLGKGKYVTVKAKDKIITIEPAESLQTSTAGSSRLPTGPKT